MNEVLTEGTRTMHTSAVGWMISCFHAKKGQPMIEIYEEGSPEYKQIVDTNPLIAKHIKDSKEKLDNSMFKEMHIFKLVKHSICEDAKDGIKEKIYVHKALIQTHSNKNKVKAYNGIYRKLMNSCSASVFDHTLTV